MPPNPQNLKPFPKGVSGNPSGRPPKARELAALAVAREIIGLAEWREIWKKALTDATTAEDGATRDKARRFIAEYLIGKPANTVKFVNDDDGGLDEFADLTDDELRAIVDAAEAAERGECEEGA